MQNLRMLLNAITLMTVVGSLAIEPAWADRIAPQPIRLDEVVAVRSEGRETLLQNENGCVRFEMEFTTSMGGRSGRPCASPDEWVRTQYQRRIACAYFTDVSDSLLANPCSNAAVKKVKLNIADDGELCHDFADNPWIGRPSSTMTVHIPYDPPATVGRSATQIPPETGRRQYKMIFEPATVELSGDVLTIIRPMGPR